MNFGDTDDLVVWATQDLYFNRNVVVGVPSRDVGRAILRRVANEITPVRTRRKTSSSLETIDGARMYFVTRSDTARGFQAKVYMHWDAPIELDSVLALCEVNYA